MALLAAIIAVVASRYLTLDPEVFFPDQREVYQANLTLLVAHISGGIAALLLGPTQFWGALRQRALGVHRALGVSYVLAVSIGTVGGFGLARIAYGGIIVQAGFASLALCWAVSTTMAVVAITRGDIATHRRVAMR